MNLSKKLDELLTSRWFLWVISLIAATSMWFFIIGDTNPEIIPHSVFVPVEFLNLDSQVTVNASASEILVEVEGLRRVIENLPDNSIVCQVDLNGVSFGKSRPRVTAKLPPNVTLVRVTPSELDVELLRQISRVLPVEVTLPQDMPAGQYLEAVEVIPREINVRATDRDMARLGSVNIAPRFADLQTGKDLTLTVGTIQSQEFEDGLILEPQQVKMSYTLVTGMPRKRVPVNVRLLGRPSPDYEVRSITTDPAEVLVQGEKEKLDKISAVDTESIDISNLAANQTVVVPLLPFEDEGVSTVNVSSVRLSIHLDTIAAQKQISNVPVSVTGAAGQAKWAVDPPVVDVTVAARPSVMETLDLDTLQLQAFVDVSGIFLRRAVLPVSAVPASEDFKVVKVEPSTLTVNAVEE